MLLADRTHVLTWINELRRQMRRVDNSDEGNRAYDARTVDLHRPTARPAD